MNPEIEGHPQDSQEKGSESFFEPRTIPKKWDVSAFVSRANTDSKGAEEAPAEPVEQPDPETTEDEGTSWKPDPFPQPRTIPGKWDVSDMK
jgi:hypothetical protein